MRTSVRIGGQFCSFVANLLQYMCAKKWKYKVVWQSYCKNKIVQFFAQQCRLTDSKTVTTQRRPKFTRVSSRWNYGLFALRYFRSRERKFPVGNIRSWELSFLGAFVPGNYRSWELSFLATFVSENFRSRELSFQERKWMRTFAPSYFFAPVNIRYDTIR